MVAVVVQPLAADAADQASFTLEVLAADSEAAHQVAAEAAALVALAAEALAEAAQAVVGNKNLNE